VFKRIGMRHWSKIAWNELVQACPQTFMGRMKIFSHSIGARVRDMMLKLQLVIEYHEKLVF
jgi:hypothetical protein